MSESPVPFAQAAGGGGGSSRNHAVPSPTPSSKLRSTKDSEEGTVPPPPIPLRHSLSAPIRSLDKVAGGNRPLPPLPKNQHQHHHAKKEKGRYNPSTRFGWWNVVEDEKQLDDDGDNNNNHNHHNDGKNSNNNNGKNSQVSGGSNHGGGSNGHKMDPSSSGGETAAAAAETDQSNSSNSHNANKESVEVAVETHGKPRGGGAPAPASENGNQQQQSQILLPPTEHSADAAYINTRLTPAPEKLREDNFPLSHLHSATSVAATLPFLSDRPPSWRYLQIETKAVGFPPVGGEIEPLFCSLAIYHVETQQTTPGGTRSAPLPNMQRCGRVTEYLNFDVVTDHDVEARCREALWPYLALSATSTATDPAVVAPPEERTQGTRCGVFPIPSNLAVANLYAIVIVHKVLSEEADVEAYMTKPDGTVDRKAMTPPRGGGGGIGPAGVDLAKFRQRAEKASNRNGRLLMQFAFGVAPLLQVFGTDVPHVPGSRGVQVPLFRLSPGQAEKSIYHHIMIMLYPRADHKSVGIMGPAPLTNGGSAVLVMRNFGYLGLHSAVDSKSLLARHRLVDFSGDLQIRQRRDSDPSVDFATKMNHRDYVVPEWQRQFLGEPTTNCGRNVIEIKREKFLAGTSTTTSAANANARAEEGKKGKHQTLYAQELAPLPLQLSVHSGRHNLGAPGRDNETSADAEPTFHTVFCNELLCAPRVLRSCPLKSHLTVKVEVRELEWKEEFDAYVAFVPHQGPCIHNKRRGPPLVRDAYTSCVPPSSVAHFIDEFKVKLPLTLQNYNLSASSPGRKLVLLLSACKVSRKQSWATFLGKKMGINKGGATIDNDGISGHVDNVEAKSKVKVLSCGFLFIATNGDSSCIIDNGLHDVKMLYSAAPLAVGGGGGGGGGGGLPGEEGALLLRKVYGSNTPRSDASVSSNGGGRGAGGAAAAAEDDVLATSSRGGGIFDRQVVDTDDLRDDSLFESESGISDGKPHSDIYLTEHTTTGSTYSEVTIEPSLRGGKNATVDYMTLQVRIVVHSSLHSQSATLSDFLQSSPSTPVPINGSSLPPESVWRLERPDLLNHISTHCDQFDKNLSDEFGGSLFVATTDLCNADVCPLKLVTSHFLRVISQLLTLLVSGPGQPSPVWANPAAIVPLRLNAFSSLIQILSSGAAFFAKNGLTQLDGRYKWNTTTLGYILSLLTNESRLLQEEEVEIFDAEQWLAIPVRDQTTPRRQKSLPDQKNADAKLRKRRHTRSDSDLIVGGSMLLTDAHSAESLKDKSLTLPPDFSDALTSIKSSQTAMQRDEEKLSESVKGQKGSNDALSSDFRVFSKADFQSALIAGSSDFSSPESLPSFVSGPNAASNSRSNNRRKWMTLPSSALATIREDAEAQENDAWGGANHQYASRSSDKLVDVVDSELVRREGKTSPVRQFRVPRVSKVADHDHSPVKSNPVQSNPPSPLNSIREPEKPKAAAVAGTKEPSLPRSDEEIENAGREFLDLVGKNLGVSGRARPKNSTGEEMRVGHAHHRKTRSRCSIDWTLPDVDTLGLEASNSTVESPPSAGSGNQPLDADLTAHLDLTMTALKDENAQCKPIPTYLDRLVHLGRSKKSGRWYPYVYEVVIFQWVALLAEQRRNGERSSIDRKAGNSLDYPKGGGVSLREAAAKGRGVTITSAPILFEIIKKSLGDRCHAMTRCADQKTKNMYVAACPPLVKLDSHLFGCLEQLISMVTDACVDSRNFDSWEFRQTSIDVNDAIVRFLRDLFAFIESGSVHRLILVYFSRFVTKEGKHFQDRDSKIALRCSWEICKLRLNAVTAFIRFRDLAKVNSPQLLNWGTHIMSSQSEAVRKFSDDALRCFLSLEMKSFSDLEEGLRNQADVQLPSMKPHWLSEIVTDICLSGAEHADPYIQHRAASLLHEMFWAQSQEARANGAAVAVGSMYVTFILKVLSGVTYFSTLPAKSQLRKDILPCVVFVFQSAQPGLLRALWRKLCLDAIGKGSNEKFGISSSPTHHSRFSSDGVIPAAVLDEKSETNVFDVFSLLNLTLATFEYEGGEDNVELESDIEGSSDQIAMWKKEFLPALEEDPNYQRAKRLARLYRRRSDEDVVNQEQKMKFSSTNSRKWQSHDASLVIINTSRNIVREMMSIPRSPSGSFPETLEGRRHSMRGFRSMESRSPEPSRDMAFSRTDIVVFVRASTSVYLHSLSTRQSDIVTIKTFIASVEIVKIFGIQIFLEAVGETFQHWMRVITIHCGARRADVRIQAMELLALVLRVTWDSFGSFSRVRLPLLAVQAEVMERIVATASARFYREQRRLGMTIQSLANDAAEASLAPLWRTIDRLHTQPASQNIAFRTALVRLATMMKSLYRAYVAAHALSIIKRAQYPLSPSNSTSTEDERSDVRVFLQSRSSTIYRIILNSAGYCKQFLGPGKASSLDATVADNEAVEDAFLEAAQVFSSTELPSLRVGWLQKLAEFHNSRAKHAEEAYCRFLIHSAYRQAIPKHDSIWSSIPFFPWASDSSDGVHLDGEGPAGDPDDYYDGDYNYGELAYDYIGCLELQHGRQLEKTESFRRIFYRVANSVGFRTGDWDITGNRTLFYGVTFASEYGNPSPWLSLREMEQSMIEEAETGGDLYMKAGIAESSRFAWGIAAQFYAEKFNYTKLSRAYRRLATVVSSQVPVVYTTDQALELSNPLGRFYRVWFHGGAPDDLIGAEYVYRADNSVNLETFGNGLRDILKSILPENTPIDLVLDDGRPEDPPRWRNQRRALAPVTIEPVKVKITPLRPIMQTADELRGTPEWFHRYTEKVSQAGQRSQTLKRGTTGNPQVASRHRSRTASTAYSSSMFRSGGNSSARMVDTKVPTGFSVVDEPGQPGSRISRSGELVGVDKFAFSLPARKDRNRMTRDWLKGSNDIADRNIRVTMLEVDKKFPACVARQPVIHRTVFMQSPLEAGVDAMCSWCSVLFRTAVATSGLSALGASSVQQGIGGAATKVISECFYSSKVREMGQILLKQTGSVPEEIEGDGTMIFDYSRLSDEEVRRNQLQLARGLLVFMEILHLLVARNRDLLLAVVDAKKQTDTASLQTSSVYRGLATIGSPDDHHHHHHHHPQNQHPSSHQYQPQRRAHHGRSASSNMSVNSQSAGYGGRQVSSPSHVRVGSYGSTTSHNRVSSVASSNMSQAEGMTPHHRSRGDIATGSGSRIASDRTQSNIAVQSELQRQFIGLAKTLYPVINGVLHTDTPRWLRSCTQENYFSSYSYRQAKLSVTDELCFFSQDMDSDENHTDDGSDLNSLVSSAEHSLNASLRVPSESPSATGSYTGSVRSGQSGSAAAAAARANEYASGTAGFVPPREFGRLMSM